MRHAPVSYRSATPRSPHPVVLALAVLVCALWNPTPLGALTAGPNDVYVRVVDVGPGLCTVTKIPGGRYLVYDAGHWVGQHCIDAVREIVEGDRIDLLILSHSDSDHLGAVPDILREYHVRQIVRAGYPRWDTATWRNLNDAIGGGALRRGDRNQFPLGGACAGDEDPARGSHADRHCRLAGVGRAGSDAE